MQVPAQAWGGASAYLTVILLGIPLTMLYNMEAALLRAVGNSMTPLLFLLFSSVLNVGLDAAFMGPLGLGVRGAAIATVLAQGISAVLGVVYILRGYPELRFTPRQLRGCHAPRRDQYVLGGPEHGADERHLQSGQRSAAKQHQRAGQRLHHGADRRAAWRSCTLSRAVRWASAWRRSAARIWVRAAAAAFGRASRPRLRSILCGGCL